MMIKKLLLGFIFLFVADAHAEQMVKASLVSQQAAITPGQPLQLGLLLDTNEGWHTYWENPGDAGMATEMTWVLPEGFTAGPIQWPTPERITEGTLATFSYEGKTFLSTTVIPPATLDESQPYTLKLHATWLVCKDICIPESADLDLTLPVSATAQLSEQAPLFAQPPRPTASGSYRRDDKNLIFSLPVSALQSPDIVSVDFFPRQQNLVHYTPPPFALQDNTLNITLEATDDKTDGAVSGILTIGSVGSSAAYDVSFSAPAPVAPEPPATNYFVVLLLAVLGGLVLNLMPCVLPVLSLKALAIAKKSGRNHIQVVRQGLAYTLGILVSFALIAGALIALRGAGESVGWGYQMQSPAFVAFLIYLLFMVGLNLSGYFHLPVLLGGVGSDIANESSARGSFFTGVLATAVATPCTAPFMASAVGIALTLPAWQSLLVFEALGFGLALPFLLISLVPRLRKFLPKPGAWMDSFKQLLAFPMYASVIWLLWVLTLQTGAGGMVLALVALLSIAVIIWLGSLLHGPLYRLVALLLYGAILVISLPMLNRMEPATAAMPGGHLMNEINKVDYSPKALADLRAAGKPVLVDATAAWCITCQINARTAIHTERTMAVFREQGITLMIADWTRRNDEITAFLGGFGFKGVPLVVFYPADSVQPVVLPQILTEDTVINTIQKKE